MPVFTALFKRVGFWCSKGVAASDETPHTAMDRDGDGRSLSGER